jgi:hypothetical protein
LGFREPLPKLKYEKIVGYNAVGEDLQWRDGERGRWEEREMGREGDGEMGRRGDGEMGREGDGKRGRPAGADLQSGPGMPKVRV